jgi:O-antigen ligase
VFIRRTLSVVGALCCALLLWSAFSANTVCALVLLLIAAIAFADPVAGLMLVLAFSPVASVAVATFWGTPGDWAEMVVLAAALGWLLRQAVRGDCFQPVTGGRAVVILTLVGIASLVVQFSVLATQISREGLAADLRESLHGYATTRNLSAQAVRPVALLLEGLAVFTAAATPRAPGVSRRVLQMFALGACGAAVLNLSRFAGGALRSETPGAAALQLARTVRISLPYADVNAAGSYFLLALCVAAGLVAAARLRMRAVWAPVAVLLGGALWISGSRTALVAALVTAVALIARRAVHARRYRALGAAAAAALLLVWLFPFPIVHPGSLLAVATRAELGRTALRLFASEPLFGVGVGQFFARSAGAIRDPAIRLLYPQENAHNNFLQVLAETGIVGMAAFLWLLIAVAQAILYSSRREEDARVLRGAAAGLCAFLATCLAGHPLLTTEVAIAFWGVLGTTVAAFPPAATTLPIRATRVAVAAAAIVLAAGLPFRIARATNAVELEHMGYRVTGWSFDRDGVRYRRMATGATLFVPARAAAIDLPYRLQWGHDPVTVQLNFRGRVANRLVVSDHRWQTYRMVVPATRGRERYLPLEIHVLAGDGSAVLLGKMEVHQRQGSR